MKAFLILLFIASAAPAQVVVPSLTPRLYSAPVLPGPAFSPVLPAPAAAASLLPVLSAPALPVPSAQPLPAPRAGALSAPAARPLIAAVAEIRQAKAEPAAAAPALDNLYEPRSRAAVPAAAVYAAPASAAPARLAPARNAVRPSVRAEPPAPPASGWKRAGAILGRTAGTLFGLWGGMKAGDIAHSLALAPLAPYGLAVALPVALGLAWYLRGRQAGLGSRLTWAAMLGSFSFSAVGQLVWDLTGSPLGLLAGIALGAALALYAGGLRRLDSKKQ